MDDSVVKSNSGFRHITYMTYVGLRPPQVTFSLKEGWVMKRITLAIIFVLSVSGCVTGSKAVKPSSGETGKSMPPMIEKNKMPEAHAAVSQQPAKPTIRAEVTRKIELPHPLPLIPVRKPVKIQYSQITNLIREFIDMNAVPGENVYLGFSENKLTILEIKGNKDDIRQASMKLLYPKGLDKTNAELNNAMMSRFLRNIAPEIPDWHSRVERILNKFSSLKTGIEGISEENIELSNRLIKILCDKNADYVVVTLMTHP